MTQYLKVFESFFSPRCFNSAFSEISVFSGELNNIMIGLEPRVPRVRKTWSDEYIITILKNGFPHTKAEGKEPVNVN